MLCLLRFNSIPVGTFFDDAHYLILAEGLATGEGYRLINFPIPAAEEAFPPGWPLLLAPLALFAPGNLFLPRLLAMACSVASVPLADRLFRDRLGSVERWGMLLLFALNPFFIGAAGTVMSEPAYLFLSLLILVIFDSAEDSPRRIWLVIAAVGLALFATAVRTLGVSILVTALFGTIPRRYWRQATWGVLGLAVVGLLLLLFAPISRWAGAFLSPTYLGHVEFLSAEILTFLQIWNFLPLFDYPLIGATIVPLFDLRLSFIPFFDQLRWIGAVVLLICVGFGFGSRVKDRALSEVYVFFFALIFYMWTAYIAEVQQRQLVPMLPFFSFYLVTFLIWLNKKLFGEPDSIESSTVGRWGIIALLGAILLTYGVRHANEIMNPVRDLIVDYSVAGEWVQANTAEDAIISVNYPTPSYLYMRRRTDFLPGNFAPDEIDAFFVNKEIDYVVIQPGLTNWNTGELVVEQEYVDFLVPHLEQSEKRYELVFEDEIAKVKIFEILAE